MHVDRFTEPMEQPCEEVLGYVSRTELPACHERHTQWQRGALDVPFDGSCRRSEGRSGRTLARTHAGILARLYGQPWDVRHRRLSLVLS